MWRCVGNEGRAIGIDRPLRQGAEVLADFGLTVEHVGREARELLKSAVRAARGIETQ